MYIYVYIIRDTVFKIRDSGQKSFIGMLNYQIKKFGKFVRQISFQGLTAPTIPLTNKSRYLPHLTRDVLS